MTCLSFVTSLKILSPNIVVLEIRASIQEFEGSSNNCGRFLIRKVGYMPPRTVVMSSLDPITDNGLGFPGVSLLYAMLGTPGSSA